MLESAIQQICQHNNFVCEALKAVNKGEEDVVRLLRTWASHHKERETKGRQAPRVHVNLHFGREDRHQGEVAGRRARRPAPAAPAEPLTADQAESTRQDPAGTAARRPQRPKDADNRRSTGSGRDPGDAVWSDAPPPTRRLSPSRGEESQKIRKNQRTEGGCHTPALEPIGRKHEKGGTRRYSHTWRPPRRSARPRYGGGGAAA